MKLYDLCQTMEQEHKTFLDMQLRVTFYARVSTKKEAQLNSKENQIETFTKIIHDNSNWEFVEGYVDTVRGESMANRDNFLRMLQDTKEDKFDLILAKEISRFSRDMLIHSLKFINLRTISVRPLIILAILRTKKQNV